MTMMLQMALTAVRNGINHHEPQQYERNRAVECDCVTIRGMVLRDSCRIHGPKGPDLKEMDL